MRPLRKLLDRAHPLFQKGGKLESLYPAYEALDSFFYTPPTVTGGPAHVRDGMDVKRTMIIVVVALVPTIYMALYNTGLQANEILAKPEYRAAVEAGWRGEVFQYLGLEHDPGSWIANMIWGALFFVPIYAVSMLVGGILETIFAIVRRHEINEGFLVTGLLFPLTLPPTVPLWQVAVGIAFGVVIGKEVFGGTGKNFLNPALTARAFLYFAYPAQLSGNEVWTAVDGFSGATPLGLCAIEGMDAVHKTTSFSAAFLGTIPGSLGETSVLACLIGAAILIITGVGSWRIMLSMLLGSYVFSWLLYAIGSETNSMFSMPPHWHLVVGGLAFGLVFMATDPVSAAMTTTGKWIYGVLIGVMTILVRVINPAFPEGVMLAILFGNVFAPVIDHYVLKANIRRRSLRTHAA